jgi:lysyl endopeptidase
LEGSKRVPAVSKRRGIAWLFAYLLLFFLTSAQAAPRVDVVAANLGPLIDRAAQSPSRFAVDVPHPASPSTDGEWSISGAINTWTYSVQIPGAVSMSFHATRASLPPSATLTVTSQDTPYVYTSKDTDGGDLWSRIGRGDSLIFELSVATADVDDVQLEIASLQAGYRAFGVGMRNHPRYDDLRAHALATTETLSLCADNWSCEITPTNEGPGNATVALIIGNIGQCSGVLLNDVPGDGTPYILTARHCENGNPNGGTPSAAANVTVHWNAVSACGASLGTIYDPGVVRQSGATTIVEQQDAWLIRLNQPPAVDAYYAGWDATGAAFVGGFTAHHAMGSARQFIGWFGQAAYFTVPA